MRFRFGIACCMAGTLAGVVSGCRQSPSNAVSSAAESSVKTYSLRGKIVAVDTAAGALTVSHQAIPGYMGAMTMPYKLVDANTISEMHVGDVITARVVVDSDAAGPMSPKLDHVVVVAQARPDNLPKVSYHVPQPGDTVPDFTLLNQSGKRIHLSQFKGKVLLMTFIYTRCPVADFCPRMSANFAAIDKELAVG